jgi:hypothetical protein
VQKRREGREYSFHRMHARSALRPCTYTARSSILLHRRRRIVGRSCRPVCSASATVRSTYVLPHRATPYHSHSRTYSSPCIYVRQRRRVVMHTTRPLEAPPRMYTSVAAESIRLADGCCWFILRGKYCRLIADDRFILTEKYLQLRRRRRCTLGRGVSGAASTGPRPRDPPDGDTPSPRRAPACVRALLSASPTHTMHARVKSLSLGLHTLYLSG